MSEILNNELIVSHLSNILFNTKESKLQSQQIKELIEGLDESVQFSIIKSLKRITEEKQLSIVCKADQEMLNSLQELSDGVIKNAKALENFSESFVSQSESLREQIDKNLKNQNQINKTLVLGENRESNTEKDATESSSSSAHKPFSSLCVPVWTAALAVAITASIPILLFFLSSLNKPIF